MAEASDFRFGTQLGFAYAHHKITPKEKSGGGLVLGELPKIFGVLGTSNLVHNLCLPRLTIKPHPEK